jgi:hypothetical protein
MHRKLAVAAALVVALAVSGYAQKKPDFTGTWTADTEKSDAAPAPGAGAGGRGPGGGRGPVGMMGPMTITQTATAIAIESQGRQGMQKRTYKLDGSEQEITFGQMTAKARAQWEGDKITIETLRRGQDGTPFSTSVTYSLNADGTLTAEYKTPMGARKVVYKKTT